MRASSRKRSRVVAYSDAGSPPNGWTLAPRRVDPYGNSSLMATGRRARMSPPRYVIPKPPCPRTLPTEYMPPCSLVPGGNAPLNALDGSVPSGAPQVPHATAVAGFLALQIGQASEVMA